MQDMSQLWHAYSKDESISSNCHVRIAFAPNRVETAEWLSRMLGTATIVKEDVSTSGKRFGMMLNQMSRTFHQISRPLLTADEVMRLRGPQKGTNDLIVEPGDMLIFIAGHAPVMGTQSLYFLDPVFRARAKLPVPETDSLHRSRVPPFQWQEPELTKLPEPAVLQGSETSAAAIPAERKTA